MNGEVAVNEQEDSINVVDPASEAIMSQASAIKVWRCSVLLDAYELVWLRMYEW